MSLSEQQEDHVQPVDIHQQVTVRPYSAYTELHWVSQARANARGGRKCREEWAVVSTTLGGRDWVAVNPAPVRVSRGTPRGGATPALYLWPRTGAHVWCESQTEKQEVMWMDFTGEVERLWPQPFAVVFGEGSACRQAWHVPDFLGVRPDGQLVLYDVRPAHLIDERAHSQFEATALVAGALGWSYHVLTGRNRMATRVLSVLKASRHERCAPPPEVADQVAAHAREGATVRALSLVANPLRPAVGATWVAHLVWHGALRLDPESGYDGATVLWSDSEVRM